MAALTPLRSLRRNLTAAPRSFSHQQLRFASQRVVQRSAGGSGSAAAHASQLSALVVGSSIEGLTTGLTLLKNAALVNVDVVEGARGPTFYEGQIVILTPQVCKIYSQLDVLQDILSVGHRVNHSTVANSKGRSWLVQDWDKTSAEQSQEAGEELPFISIEKNKLVEVLLRKLRQEQQAGVVSPVRRGGYTEGKITNLQWLEQAQKLQCTQQKTFIRNSYDILIGAEGVNSSVRNALFSNGAEIPGGVSLPLQHDHVAPASIGKEYIPALGTQEFASVVFQCPSELDYQDQCFEWWVQKSRMGVVPLSGGRIALYGYMFNDQMSTSLEHKGLQVIAVMQKYYQRVKGLGGELLLNHLGRIVQGTQGRASADPSLRTYAEPTQYLMLNDAVHPSGRIVLVGGSAHSIDNSLWQQSTIDAEDGFILGKQLAQTAQQQQTLQQALTNYNNKRVTRISELHEVSRLFNRTSYNTMPFDFVKNLKMVGGGQKLLQFRMKKAIQPDTTLFQ